jgi:hypothetical protein
VIKLAKPEDTVITKALVSGILRLFFIFVPDNLNSYFIIIFYLGFYYQSQINFYTIYNKYILKVYKFLKGILNNLI